MFLPLNFFRKLDSSGRYVIPAQIRKEFGINANEEVGLWSKTFKCISRKLKKIQLYFIGLNFFVISFWKNIKCGNVPEIAHFLTPLG